MSPPAPRVMVVGLSLPQSNGAPRRGVSNLSRSVGLSVSARSIFISTPNAINLRHRALLRREQASQRPRARAAAAGLPPVLCPSIVRTPGGWRGKSKERAVDGRTDRTSEANKRKFVVNHARRSRRIRSTHTHTHTHTQHTPAAAAATAAPTGGRDADRNVSV